LVVFSVMLGGWYISAVLARCWLKSHAGVNCAAPSAGDSLPAFKSLRDFF
jgi:hypothetical protein